MDILYKYVPADRIQTCIPEVGNGTLRATQPLALNDPFECHVVDRYTGVEEDQDFWLSTLLTDINPTTPVRKEDVMVARDEHGSLYLRELLSAQISQRFGVISFSTDPYHPMMWAHYTVDGSGFVIGYDRGTLESLGCGKDYLRPVEYHQTPPRILHPIMFNEKNLSQVMFAKGHQWEYESEWRLIVELSETVGTGQNDGRCQPISLVQVPNSAIRSVYYTERTPKKRVNQIRARLGNPNNLYLAVMPKQLSLSKSSYRYEYSA